MGNVKEVLGTFQRDSIDMRADIDDSHRILKDYLENRIRKITKPLRQLHDAERVAWLELAQQSNSNNTVKYLFDSVAREDYAGAIGFARSIMKDTGQGALYIKMASLVAVFDGIEPSYSDAVNALEYLHSSEQLEKKLRDSIRAVRGEAKLSDRVVGSITHQQILQKQPQQILDAMEKGPPTPIQDAEINQKMSDYQNAVKTFVNAYNALKMDQYMAAGDIPLY